MGAVNDKLQHRDTGRVHQQGLKGQTKLKEEGRALPLLREAPS